MGVAGLGCLGRMPSTAFAAPVMPSDVMTARHQILLLTGFPAQWFDACAKV